jgi:two-component system NtrC family response regulator
METILIVDDEKNYLVVLEALLGAEGYEIVTARDAKMAVSILREADIDLVITDMKMPGMSGMELLAECKKINPEIPVIMMTAFGTIEMAVEAMKKHAYDYIQKPFENEKLKLTVKKAMDNRRLLKDNRLLAEALSNRFRYGNMVGKSKPMMRVYDLIDKVSNSKASVLITGPSGTGKELIAKAIHYQGPRKERPLISINCGALTETLLASELFGHEKGAFTGAVAMKKGGLNWRMAAPYFWTKSERCRRHFRSSYCGSFRRWSLNGWGGPAPSKWMSGFFPLQTETSKRTWPKGYFVKICTIA